MLGVTQAFLSPKFALLNLQIDLVGNWKSILANFYGTTKSEDSIVDGDCKGMATLVVTRMYSRHLEAITRMKHHSKMPKAGCPLPGASPMKGTIYRAIENAVPGPIDMLSHRERNLRCNASSAKQECKCCGTSVYVSVSYLKFLKDGHASFRDKNFIAIDVEPTHGVILPTPSSANPEHQTFWRDCTIDFVPLSRIVSVGSDG